MDYVAPKQLVADMLETAQKKAALPVRDLMIVPLGVLRTTF